jgi:diguanylate cyclase (GGDEF)-like protein
MIRQTSLEPAAAGTAAGSFLHIVADGEDAAGQDPRIHDLERELRTLRGSIARVETELARSRVREIEARHLAMHDPLTQLPNQRYFRECVQLALKAASPPARALVVLYIDLDGFKQINDTHGHTLGDRFLQIMADRLSHSMRAEDMVCRLGGDEFACLLRGLSDRRRISQVATKVGAVLSAPVCIDGTRLRATASIGIAMSPADGITVEDLVAHADAAMYRAKKALTRYTFYRPEKATVGRLPGVVRGV